MPPASPRFPDAVLRMAEDLNTHLPLRLGDLRLMSESHVVTLAPGMDPHFNIVQRLRLRPDQVAAAVAEVRQLLREHGRTSATWEVGPSSTPPDLCERLLALGMTPDEPEPVATGMVLAAPPAAERPAAVEVRPVEAEADYRRSTDIFRLCFGQEALADPDEAEAEAERDFARYQATDTWERYLALIDGRAVAAADATLTPAGVVLSGGATLSDARGAGAYRALVWARWDEAVRRGTPMLVTQASSMSRPILLRLGFVPVAEVRVFIDREAP